MLKNLKKIWGQLFFAEAAPIIQTGKQRTLTESDFLTLPDWLNPKNVAPGFRTLDITSVNGFLLGILLSNKKRMALVAVIVGGLIATNLMYPELMHRLITGMKDLVEHQGTVSASLGLTLGFALIIILNALLLQHYLYNVVNMELFIINGLNYRIFAKALKLSRKGRNKTPIGDIVNHLGSDTNAVSEFPFIMAEVIYGIAISSLVLIMAWRYVGWGAVSAFLVLLILSPLCHLVAKKYILHDEELKNFRDHRVSLMSQFISGIKIVKFLAWEQFAEKDILDVRDKETLVRRKLALTRSLSLLLFLGANSLAIIAAFATWVVNGNKLDAATVFACVALFDLWQHPFSNLSNYIAGLAEARVSAKRLTEFLNQDEFVENIESEDGNGTVPGLCLSQYSSRHHDGDADVVSGWNLTIQPGQSVAIIGSVGCGKTSFLLSLLGELPVSSGSKLWSGIESTVKPKVAWIPQTPYILNSTVRENILIGSEGGDIAAALHATALDQDIRAFPAGLDTEIGEQGLNLSGGQKQRLSLARAAMMEADVVLLDDPLSAVDKHTEEHLIDHLVFGRWADKTRIMVTHRLEFLDRFDRVVFVKDGAIAASGSAAELYKFSREYREFIREHRATDAGRNLTTQVPAVVAVKTKVSGAGLLTEVEDREEGAVSANVYFSYLAAMCGPAGWRRIVGAIVLIGTTATVGLLPLAQNYWLSIWTGSHIGENSAGMRSWLVNLADDDATNLAIFAALGLAAAAAGFFRMYLWTFRSINAGREFHNNALAKTLRTFQRFYDSNPVGRILNRFSMDVDTVEGHLAMSFEQMVYAIGNVLAVSIAIFLLSPWTLVVLLPCAFLFYRLQLSYRCAARDTKRLSAVTRSPRFAHFKETLEGLDSIRAYGLEYEFFTKYFALLEKNQKMFYAMVVENRWFSTRLPLISAAITMVSVGALVLAAQRGFVDPAAAGLLLVYNLFFVDYLNFGVRSFSEAEARMTSVERLLRYSRHPEEPSVVGATTSTPKLWPTAGAIEFQNVNARYAWELPDVLKDVSLVIPGGYKVGVIGRTGSGKSTFLQILFRMIPLTKGRILIDGEDIAAIPLHRLRRSIAIIPQDPTLFIGTIRSNLDRYNEHSEMEIWEALSKVQLAGNVKSLTGELDFLVLENGSNFSQGQRQLFCLARAILSDARIIAMDEATASVDVVTDRMIQKTIREAFTDRTMIIIAHRLGTISDCDMIVEISEGVVASVSDAKVAKELQFKPSKKVSPEFRIVPASR